jgi:hypothetical protein
MGTTTSEEAPLTTTLKPIYVRFVFKEQQQALCFAELIVEREWLVSVVYAPERALWQATVRREIHPVFRDITVWLATLTSRAAPSNGECDGWGH